MELPLISGSRGEVDGAEVAVADVAFADVADAEVAEGRSSRRRSTGLVAACSSSARHRMISLAASSGRDTCSRVGPGQDMGGSQNRVTLIYVSNESIWMMWDTL